MSAMGQRRTAAAAATTMLFAVLQFVLFAVHPSSAEAAGNINYSVYEFVFANGTVMAGSTLDDGGGLNADVTIPGFTDRQIHVSCSDVFGGGPDGGYSDGGDFPLVSDGADWRIASYTIERWQLKDDVHKFNKKCGETFIPGTITVKKIADDGTEAFVFSLEGEIAATPTGTAATFGPSSSDPVDGDNSDTYTWDDLDAGTYDLKEILTDAQMSAGWELVSATCDDGSTVGAIDLVGNENVTCTFTNELPVDPTPVTVSVAGVCAFDGVASYTYTVTADAGVTVDFDGGNQNLGNGGTYVSVSGSAGWVATAPDGTVFSGDSSGTVNVADCTPQPPGEVTVSVAGVCAFDGVASYTYTVTADAGVTVDFDGGNQNLGNGGTYVSVSGSAGWVATAPDGTVFSGDSSGTVNVADCTPPPPGEVTVSVAGVCAFDGVASYTYTVTADAGVTVDFDGGNQNLGNGGTYVSVSGSAGWVATAPDGTVFSGDSSGTVNVADCTPQPTGTTTTTTTTPPQVAPKGAIGDYVWLDSDKDGQQDPDEVPVPGAEVTLLSSDGTVLATQLTDANGNYRFDDLEAGNYRVQVCVAGVEFTVTNATEVADDVDSDVFAAGDICALTSLINLPAGVTDLTWDAGVIVVVGGIQIEPTTTTTVVGTTIEPVTVGTLPFTGFEYEEAVRLALILTAVGSVVLLAVGRREDEAETAAVHFASGWTNNR